MALIFFFQNKNIIFDAPSLIMSTTKTSYCYTISIYKLHVLLSTKQSLARTVYDEFANDAFVALVTNQTTASKQKAMLADVVEVAVFYDSLNIAVMDESPKISSEELLGAIGGHLHLFLGMSLLSFVELLELFVEMLIQMYNIKK